MSIAQQAARASGEIMLELFGRAAVTEKAYNNLVTEADYRSEKAIIASVRSVFPEHTILAEETTGDQDRFADHLWIIDPLDGTNNYAHGIPFSSVSIAYAEKGSVLAGVVFDPFRDELFQAEKGSGALLNGRPITVSDRTNIKGAIISTGFYYSPDRLVDQTLAAMQRLFNAGLGDIRRTGSAALDCAYTAAGRFDGYFEYELAVWDYAAGMLILREAGGCCSDRFGGELDLKSTGVIVSNRNMHKEFADIAKWEQRKGMPE